MRFNTGVIQLDSIIKGGFPPGVSELFGEDACGKTTLALSVMREASLRGLPTAYICTEGLPDPNYIQAAGPKDCISITPTFGEAAIEAAYSSLDNGVRVVVIDTATAINPLAERDLLLHERAPYAKRRLVFHGLSVLRKKAKEVDSLVLVVNQVRIFIKSLSKKPKSSFDGTIDNLCDIRVRVRRESTRNSFGKLDYIKTEMYLIKSLVSPPSTFAFGFLFNQKGFDRGFELLRQLLAKGLLKKAGAYIKDPDGFTLGCGYVETAKIINEHFDRYWRMCNGGKSNF